MKIYIVRHGETNSNKNGRLQGWYDDPLNEFGIKLAQETGKAIKGTKFDAIYSSSLSRAMQTAQIIRDESGNSCDIISDDRIKEICMGDFEGKQFRGENGEIDSSLVRSFMTAPIGLPPFPNGESVTDVMARTQDFLKELALKDHDTVLVSTHGCALRCMLNFLYDDPSDFWHGHVPYNCCINIVEAKDGKLELIADDLILYDDSLKVDRYS